MAPVPEPGARAAENPGTHPTVLALADDLTGALEVGAKFAAAGLRSVVSFGWREDAAPVLVIDTETRHLAPAEAAARVRRHAAEGRRRGVAFVYKKTDSTLRGNIAAELAAVTEAWDAPLVYAPAYPAMGRIVRGGVLYVDGTPVSETEFGRDALNPVRSSDVRGLIPCPAVTICDGETDADLRSAAEALLAAGHALAAGPAALAEHLAALLRGPRSAPAPLPKVRRCLVVNGSRHPVSLRQMAAFEPGGGWAALETRDPTAAGDAAARTAADALVIFGGDTACAIVEAMGSPPLYPLGDALPGVPVTRAGNLTLITKAGGFGPPDVLARLRERLT